MNKIYVVVQDNTADYYGSSEQFKFVSTDKQVVIDYCRNSKDQNRLEIIVWENGIELGEYISFKA